MDQTHYRPRSTSELIDGTIRLVRANYRTLLPLALVGYLPIVLLFTLLPLTPDEQATADQTLGFTILAGMPFFVFWFILFDAALVKAAGDAYLGRPSSAGEAVKAAARRYWRVVGTNLAKFILPWLPFAVALALGLALGPVIAAAFGIATFVLGVMIFLRLVVLPATVLFEDNGVVDGVRRGLTLTEGEKWRSFKAIILIYFIWTAIYFVFYLAGMLAMFNNPRVAMIVMQVAAALGYPLFSTLYVLLYFDFRIRKEAYDIDLMSQAMPATTARSAAV